MGEPEHSTTDGHHGFTGTDVPNEGDEALDPPIPNPQLQGHAQVAAVRPGAAGNQKLNPITKLDDEKHLYPTSYEDGCASPSNTTTDLSSYAASTFPGESNVADSAHVMPADLVVAALRSDVERGLTADEAATRLARDGLNKVHEAKGSSAWEIFLRQISNSLTLVLVIVMGISFGIGDWIEAGVIAAVIVLNIVVGFIQDYRAEQQIMSLQALSAPVSDVIRDGKIQNIKAEHLVIGDIVKLSTGAVVPADLRLVESVNVSIDEALLTGESLPVSKSANKLMSESHDSIGDRSNMCYAATTMARGRGIGVVVSVGMNTEVGKIARLLHHKQPGEDDGSGWFMKRVKAAKLVVLNVLGLTGTPLQRKLSIFALLLFALAILLAVIVFSVSLWDIDSEVLIYGICVGVAVIPESLIAVLTITIAVGTKAMARGNVIVRRLASLEAVGGVNVICSDKTGTLTQGRMIVREARIAGAGVLEVSDSDNPFNPNSGHVSLDEKPVAGLLETRNSGPASTFLHSIALCNLSTVYNEAATKASNDTQAAADNWIGIGEPTEIALQVFAMRFNHGKSTIVGNGERELLFEFPFDSSVKRMTVVYKNTSTDAVEAFSKGATEAMVPLLAVSAQEKENILANADKMASKGLRVLCIAYKDCSTDHLKNLEDRSGAESNLTFCGLVGLYDPPRTETAGAVRKCQVAGISVHMLTGDHVRTAEAVAREVGILSKVQPATGLVVQASEFDKLSDGEIDELESLPLVLARCSPSTKVRVVEALKRRGKFSVMTGDGVNDSPSLKKADVGIAMGLNGTDVAKDASDMILTDDNFASIVKAIEEGRRLFDNIQKFLLHLLVSNISQVILLLCGLAFMDNRGYSVFPLSPLEILWVNLITSSFLAIGLGLEEAIPDIMIRPPRDIRVGVFTRELIVDKMMYGTFMGALCLVAFTSVAYGFGNGQLGHDCNQGFNESCDVVFRARSTTWATLTMLLLVTAWEVKHLSRSLFALDVADDDKQGSESRLGAFARRTFGPLKRNRFLLWAIVAGFCISFPVIYIPTVNILVFKHKGITYEWGVVFACLAVYVALVESWKAVKRRFGIGTSAKVLAIGQV